ncbi:MAG: hypothetical protein JO297_14700 [Nitrososphaeraceae archaeon]|nr:hypothetical protein [Nitrososphaeraceae archaeon]
MRRFPVSATYTFPDESIARSCGVSNWPLPEPTKPNSVINVPSLVNF